MQSGRLRANTGKFYLSAFFGGWAFALGFLVLYYRQIGFSYLQIFAVAITYELLNFALEIPTGALADLWSRKWTITLGHAISGLSFFVVMLRPEAYGMYLLWSVLSAIATTLNSGTLTAIIYDSLHAGGDEDEFARLQGRLFALTLLTQTVAYILGGVLADRYGFSLVLALSGIGGLLQAAILATLAEPPIAARQSAFDLSGAAVSWRVRFARQITSSFSLMLARARVRWLIAFGLLTFVVFEFFRVVSQPYLAGLGFDSRAAVAGFSAIFALISALSSLAVGQLKSRRAEKPLLLVMAFTVTLPLIALGLAPGYWGLAALFVECIAIGAAEVVLPDAMNRLIPSDKRATILSAQNQVGSLGYALAAVLIGTAMDRIGLTGAAAIVGVAAAALFALLLACWPSAGADAPAPLCL